MAATFSRSGCHPIKDNYFIDMFLTAKALLPRIVSSILIGIVLAFGFDALFLNLVHRPPVDQALLIFFSSVAFGYLTFYFLESRQEIRQLFQFEKITINRSSVASFFREHLAGILLAILFFSIYTYIGLKLNNPAIDTTDNYLDADNIPWMLRIASPEGSSLEMRGPHPFAYFIFRPLGWILNLFTRNPSLSSILLNTFMGGVCVFLAWMFIKNETQNRLYAFLIASLLGLSTAHLFLGSVVETYIFSAAALIGFFLILQARRDTWGGLVLTGLITFGITLTNFVQTFIGFALSRPRLKEIVRFAGLTLSLGVLLSLLHSAWYPSSKLFFLPSDAQAEGEFAFSIFQEPSWRAVGRVLLLVRTILLYAVIAPRPYVFGEEVGGTFPRFNFFKIAPETFSYSSYDGLGNGLVLFWALLLLTSSLFFFWNILRTRRVDFTLTFALCILFNFLLHVNYGYEPFLYSPDWAYALIFFVALALAPLAKNRILQGGLCIFLILLAYNQWAFFKFVFDTVDPFL